MPALSLPKVTLPGRRHLPCFANVKCVAARIQQRWVLLAAEPGLSPTQPLPLLLGRKPQRLSILTASGRNQGTQKARGCFKASTDGARVLVQFHLAQTHGFALCPLAQQSFG